MSDNALFASPRNVNSTDDCFFYHFMDLPQTGTVGSTWDLRRCVDAYLGNQDFQNKRVLDVGTASGFLTFEMEKRGAEMVSFDMPSVESWNFVPHFALRERWDQMVQSRSDCHRQLQNAYWYAHRRLQSRAKVHYGNVYDLPAELGNFDVVFLGMILPHLRDPFQALYSASRLAAETLIVTNPGKRWDPIGKLFGKNRYEAKFLPSAKNSKCDVWWALSISCIERMLETLGFEVTEKISSSAPCYIAGKKKQRSSVSLVAKRISGQPEGISVPQSAAA